PNCREVAGFIGSMNFLEGRLLRVTGEIGVIDAGPLGELKARVEGAGGGSSGQGAPAVRPPERQVGGFAFFARLHNLRGALRGGAAGSSGLSAATAATTMWRWKASGGPWRWRRKIFAGILAAGRWLECRSGSAGRRRPAFSWRPAKQAPNRIRPLPSPRCRAP